MQVQSYIFFEGRCEEALDFYKSKLGAQVAMLMRMKESPEPPNPEMCPPGSEEKIMHCAFTIGTTTLMGSDGRCSGKPNFQGISLALSAPTESEAKRLFDGLGDGGQVQMPMTKTFFSPAFGMVADRFGVSWMVMADPEAGKS
jgi:PhnB protein